MRIDRMLAITVLLLGKKKVTATELAERFSVSVRTVYRDIDAINMAGIPIVSFQGKEGGFGIMDNYKIDRQLLTLKDMGAILCALKGMNSVLNQPSIQATIGKIEGSLPKEQHLSELEQVVVDMNPWGYSKRERDNLVVVQEAISSFNLLSFEYQKFNGETNIRQIEPMTLVYKGMSWYLFGYCLLRNDYRIFKLSRMRTIQKMPETFARRDESFKEHMNWDNIGAKTIPLVLRFSAKVRFRVMEFYMDERLEFLENGDIIVRVEHPDEDWILSYLLSYGDNVEVLEPPSLRATIIEVAKKILAHYSNLT